MREGADFMVGENRLGNVVLQMLLNWEFTHAKDAKPRRRSGRRRGTQRNTGDLFFIGEGIAHAKAAKPRRRSGRRRGTQRNTGDLFFIGEEIAHAKVAKVGRGGR
jgi:hypothetical protein